MIVYVEAVTVQKIREPDDMPLILLNKKPKSFSAFHFETVPQYPVPDILKFNFSGLFPSMTDFRVWRFALNFLRIQVMANQLVQSFECKLHF